MYHLGHFLLALVHFRKETKNISLKITLLAVGYQLNLEFYADLVSFNGKSSILNVFKSISINFDID